MLAVEPDDPGPFACGTAPGCSSASFVSFASWIARSGVGGAPARSSREAMKPAIAAKIRSSTVTIRNPSHSESNDVGQPEAERLEGEDQREEDEEACGDADAGADAEAARLDR